MKTVLKSLLMIALVATMTVGASGAYFNSIVTAADNQINTGTLMLGLATTRTHTDVPTWGFPNAYWTAYDNNGNNATEGTLETWANAAPGMYTPYVAENGADTWVDGNYSYWVAVANIGSLDLKYSATVTGGDWTAMPRIGTTSCTSVPDLASANDNLVVVENIHRYATTAGGGCEDHEECRNLRDALSPFGYTPATTTVVDHTPAAAVYYGTDSGLAGGTEIVLDPQEYVIYRVDVSLDETADNCYQNATYQYDLVGNGYQVADPVF